MSFKCCERRKKESWDIGRWKLWTSGKNVEKLKNFQDSEKSSQKSQIVKIKVVRSQNNMKNHVGENLESHN